jgi:hypothetical protein
VRDHSRPQHRTRIRFAVRGRQTGEVARDLERTPYRHVAKPAEQIDRSHQVEKGSFTVRLAKLTPVQNGEPVCQVPIRLPGKAVLQIACGSTRYEYREGPHVVLLVRRFAPGIRCDRPEQGPSGNTYGQAVLTRWAASPC